MTRLAHLTDLHFGLHRAGLVGPLRDAVRAARPDVVAVSGDLTQRARAGQFAQAMEFLHGLGAPLVVIPGNHDLPVLNPLARLFDPFGPFRRGAAADLAPEIQVGPLRLFGINTADPLRWRGGVARRDAIDRICRALRRSAPGTVNIAVCHHPLEEPPGFQRGETRGGGTALGQMAEAGLHIALSGHLHHWTTGLGITDRSLRAVFQMQTGTALCDRARERAHGFALLDIAADRLAVTRWILDEDLATFLPQPATRYTRAAGQWAATP